MILIAAVQTAEFVQCGVHGDDRQRKVPLGIAS